MNLADLRRHYALQTLSEDKILPDAIHQFNAWMQEAIESRIPEPNAMTLATVSADNKPAARIVLLKGVEHNAFVFFTNYHSHKGQHIEHNPNVALCFLWHELERQVRIEGTVTKLSENESADYFKIRPRASQVGALASAQSEVISSRAVLEKRYADIDAQYKGVEIPKPEHWGGYAVHPTVIEFWQGRHSRLHDRLRYTLQSNHEWLIERLSP